VTSDIQSQFNNINSSLSNYAGIYAANTFTNTNTFASIITNGSCTHTGGTITYGGTLPTTTSSNAGLGVAWNKQGGGGLGECDLISYGQGGIGGYNFYNVTTSAVCYLLAQLKNTGEFICNSLTISSGLATLYNIVGYSANITNIKCDTIVVEKSIMNSANKVFVGSGVNTTWLTISIDLINYSTYSKNFAISTIVHTGNHGRFVFNEAPTDLNIGQIIYLFHPNLDYGDLFVDGNNFNNGTNQKFLYNGYTGQLTSQILITQGTSCQLIYMGDNTWLGIMTYTPSSTPTDSNYVSGSINSTTYLNISIPSFPSNPF
jgi:hypothetical protein